MIASRSCAQAARSCTGFTVPSVFDTRLEATTFTRTLALDLVQRVELQLAGLVDRDRLERRSRSAGHVLPRDEARMVLEIGDDDEVARAEIVETPGVRDEVQRLGRAAREDHLALGRRVHVARNLASRASRIQSSRARPADRRRGGRSRTSARRTRAARPGPAAASASTRPSRGMPRACRSRARRRPRSPPAGGSRRASSRWSRPRSHRTPAPTAHPRSTLPFVAARSAARRTRCAVSTAFSRRS